MNRKELIEYCLTYADAYEDYPFDEGPEIAGAWAAIRHRLNKRTFAFIYQRDGETCVNLKCEPARADFLRLIYAGVRPAYHMNKVHWNTVVINSDVPQVELYDMIEHSYRLTIKPGKTQRKGVLP